MISTDLLSTYYYEVIISSWVKVQNISIPELEKFEC